MSQKFVIIAAGGSGTRIGGSLPKQFIALQEGKPLIVYTIEAFINYDATIKFIIALPSDYISYWMEYISPLVKNVHITLVEGGKERFDTIKNALPKVDDNSLVAIQDAVRPFVSTQLIGRCFDSAEQYGNAIPVIPLQDSIRQVKGDASVMLDRNQLRAIQTPQCFQAALLKKAYTQEYNPLFTDDASVLEATGATIHLVEGEQGNIKITTPADMEYAGWALSRA